MEVKNFGIREKIIAGFLILIIIFGLNGAYNLITINASERVLWEILNEKDPSIQNLNKFSYLISGSMNTTSGIVYEYSAHELGESKLQDDLVDTKKKLLSNGVFWRGQEERKILKELMEDYEKWNTLKNVIKKFKAEGTSKSDSIAEAQFNSMYVPLGNRILERTGILINVKELEKNVSKATLTESFGSLKNGIFTLGLLIIVICIATSIYTSFTVLNQIKKIATVTEDLSIGVHPHIIENVKNDEVGIMAAGMNKLIVGLKQTTEFAENIGKGNFDAPFTPLSDEDVLGNSLINMRDNLKKVTEEDKLRNWANEGYAKFSDILRLTYTDRKEFGYAVISALVKYLEANQGMFFVVHNEYGEEYLEETATYAWNRRKYVDGKYKKGEGLAGQAWIEGEYIFMTDVPEEYVTIRSGIGGATPRSIIVVPLKYNEEIFGVIELASFKVFTKAEIDLILKIAENAAATLSNSMTAHKMKTLLEDTQVKTLQLKEQEEEMRQNLEELEATQEDMKNRERETNNTLKAVSTENEELKRQIEELEAKVRNS